MKIFWASYFRNIFAGGGGGSVSRQFLTLKYPRPSCLLKCLPSCLSPSREDTFSYFKIDLVVRVIARQLSGKNCLAAIFASRHQDASLGPLGWGRFVIFPVLCLPAYGTLLSSPSFTRIWGAHKKGCDNDIFRAVFPSMWVLWNQTEGGGWGQRGQSSQNTVFSWETP